MNHIDPPEKPVRLAFIHHSCGGNWLSDNNGGLGIALADYNYYVSDTNYGWGPDCIGDRTDTGHWWSWFRGDNNRAYLDALYLEGGMHASYTRLPEAPSGENDIILFKSCYPNSEFRGGVHDPIPSIQQNPLRGEDCSSPHHTLSNAKGIYIDLLNYFQSRPDKLFIAVTAPPVSNDEWAENARLFNNWLVQDWLKIYTSKNVGVFDFYNILTNKGKNNTSQYSVGEGDDHPSSAGNRMATAEFIPILNGYYNAWIE